MSTKDSRLCINHGCKNKRWKGNKKCGTCRKREWREKFPMKAAFQTLRHNATRRGKVFTITFNDFKEFCYETNYMAGKGRKKKSFTIDRIDNAKGYVPGNLQKLTKSENSKKHTKTLMYDWETKTAIVVSN